MINDYYHVISVLLTKKIVIRYGKSENPVPLAIILTEQRLTEKTPSKIQIDDWKDINRIAISFRRWHKIRVSKMAMQNYCDCWSLLIADTPWENKRIGSKADRSLTSASINAYIHIANNGVINYPNSTHSTHLSDTIQQWHTTLTAS